MGIIFGGAFDPPHSGHMQAAEYILKHNIAELLVVMPVGKHPFDKATTLPIHRLMMTQLACAPLLHAFPDRVSISEYELKQQGYGYSYQTLQHYAQLFPGYSWRWLIGADNIEHFHKWHHAQRILDEFGVVVYPRNKVDLSQVPAGMTVLAEAPPLDMSSTQARQACRDARLLHQPLDPSVQLAPDVTAYIYENAVY
jgi:nicotinate-nucleotide adenylyltransferase